MSKDVDSVSRSLFESGAEQVIIKDFHRTGYNIFPELITSGAKIVHGYYLKPIMGIGKTYNSNIMFMIGMHSSSGSNGFIPHTLTSRFTLVEVNGKLLSEAELFSSSVFKKSIIPVFFSGCSSACEQAKNKIKSLKTFVVDKPLKKQSELIRAELAENASKALKNVSTKPFILSGPFDVKIIMRDGCNAAEHIRKIWQLEGDESEVLFHSESFEELYEKLIDIAYFHPSFKRNLKTALKIFNIWGKVTHLWARRKAIASRQL